MRLQNNQLMSKVCYGVLYRVINLTSKIQISEESFLNVLDPIYLHSVSLKLFPLHFCVRQRKFAIRQTNVVTSLFRVLRAVGDFPSGFVDLPEIHFRLAILDISVQGFCGSGSAGSDNVSIKKILTVSKNKLLYADTHILLTKLMLVKEVLNIIPKFLVQFVIINVILSNASIISRGFCFE